MWCLQARKELLPCLLQHVFVLLPPVLINRAMSPSVGTEGIRLLDVGSCYNPFAEFEGFRPVAIDLTPAVEVCYVSASQFFIFSVTSAVVAK